jgi:hypothetical protein
MGLFMTVLEDDGEEIPKPTALKDIILGENDVPYLVDVFMPAARATVKDVYVKKTLTLPASLAYKAEKAGVNFSKVLRNSLEEYLKADDEVLKVN